MSKNKNKNKNQLFESRQVARWAFLSGVKPVGLNERFEDEPLEDEEPVDEFEPEPDPAGGDEFGGDMGGDLDADLDGDSSLDMGDDGKVELAGDVEDVVDAILGALSDKVAGLDFEITDDGTDDDLGGESDMSAEAPVDDVPMDDAPPAEEEEELPMEGLKLNRKAIVENVTKRVMSRLSALNEAKNKPATKPAGKPATRKPEQKPVQKPAPKSAKKK